VLWKLLHDVVELRAGNSDVRGLEGGLGMKEPKIRVISPKVREFYGDSGDILGGLGIWHVDVDVEGDGV